MKMNLLESSSKMKTTYRSNNGDIESNNGDIEKTVPSGTVFSFNNNSMNHEKEFKDGMVGGVLLTVAIVVIIVGLIYYNL